MRMLRTYVDMIGESHFDEIEVAFSFANFAPPAPPVEVSDRHDAGGFLLVRVPAGWEGAWHPPPVRQIWVGITGTLRVSTSDGETRDIKPGDCWLMEDISGKGHTTAAVGGIPAVGAITQLR